jgi:hypothetical protein
MIGVDEERLRGEGLTPNEAFYLLSLRAKEDVVIGHMSNKGFLIEFGYLGEDERLTEKGEKYLNEVFKKVAVRKIVTEDSVRDLAEKYRELFPVKVMTGNMPVKGNLNNIIRKMVKFRTDHPKYTDEVILAATAKYVEDKRKEGYVFMTSSEYMISKNNISLLASLCDSYLEGKNGGGDKETKWGRHI